MLACNVGKTDKIIRLIIGIILIVTGYFLHSWIISVIGLLSVITAVVGRCGLYYPLKIDTTKKDK